MKAEIIVVGSELLTPFFTDTNSFHILRRLDELGIRTAYKTTVGDDEADILAAARTAFGRADLILVSGGLGPTEDDRTREVFCRALGRKLIFQPALRRRIKGFFDRRGVPMAAANLKQCRIIEGAEILDNDNGTAPGLWLDDERLKLALLPGPPKELIPMFDERVLPRLKELSGGARLFRRTLKLTGLGESAMEDRIRSVYPALPSEVSVITLSKPGDLTIIISAGGEALAAEAALDSVERMLKKKVGRWLYSDRGWTLESVVASLLFSARATVACAESCTGGLVSDRLTSIPGSSAYFLESVVTYSNRSKIKRLGIPADLIGTRGAVSREVAAAMAESVRKRSGATYGLATTGIAGPGGGTKAKPVGLVYTAVTDGEETVTAENLFFGGREHVKFLASQRVLDLLRRKLLSLGGKV